MTRPGILWLTDKDLTHLPIFTGSDEAVRALTVLSPDDPVLRSLDFDAFALIVFNAKPSAALARLEAELRRAGKGRQFLTLTKPPQTDCLAAVLLAGQALAVKRAKECFFAHVIHDLNSPLGAIMGFSDLLKQQRQLPVLVGQYVNYITRNAQKLADLCGDLLSLSKFETGRFPIRLRQVNLLEELETLCQAYMLQSRAKRLNFSMRFVGPVPEMIDTDPLRLGQILTNLVTNAVKFTDKGRVEVSVIYDGADLRINVADTGPGIRAQVRDLIFSPYEQGDEGIARRYGGTGLGLAVARGLATELGGEVNLEASLPGVGSVFNLRLPVTVPKTTKFIEDANARFEHFTQRHDCGVSSPHGPL